VYHLRPTDIDFIHEASGLGLRPGHWPKDLQLEGLNWEFIRYERSGEGEVTAAVYCDVRTRLKRLVILND
jgi:hypothetical protein